MIVNDANPSWISCNKLNPKSCKKKILSQDLGQMFYLSNVADKLFYVEIHSL